ncbi:hypothetical protein AXG93_2016s1360 [Marchantia polymorpha subsp. ruderalis]|uniref:Uncharacterized protein n=1 Tax=Marchantia polymorpha subsp. ruderalis TaxID=1480154 RepID=A0A176VWJ8_MARPO|nr:hypothetical protein AXG93_2016s1360 [Marchantia polymorpha subsp. ruderalis]
MSGDSRSRRRVAKRLDAFLVRSRDAIANLEAEVIEVLRQLGLRSRAEDWSGRELVRGRPSHRRHSSPGTSSLCAFVSLVLSPRKRSYSLTKLPHFVAEGFRPNALS